MSNSILKNKLRTELQLAQSVCKELFKEYERTNIASDEWPIISVQYDRENKKALKLADELILITRMEMGLCTSLN